MCEGPQRLQGRHRLSRPRQLVRADHAHRQWAHQPACKRQCCTQDTAQNAALRTLHQKMPHSGRCTKCCTQDAAPNAALRMPHQKMLHSGRCTKKCCTQDAAQNAALRTLHKMLHEACCTCSTSRGAHKPSKHKEAASSDMQGCSNDQNQMISGLK